MLSADYLKINSAAPQDPQATDPNDTSKVAAAVSSATPQPDTPENPSPLAMTMPGVTPTEPPTSEEKTEPTSDIQPQPEAPTPTAEGETVEQREDRPDPHDNHYDLHEPEDGQHHFKSLASTPDEGIFTDPAPEEKPTGLEETAPAQTQPSEPAPASESIEVPASEPAVATPEPPQHDNTTDTKSHFSSLLKERIDAENAALKAAEEEETRLLQQAAEATKKVKSIREQIKKLSSLEDLDPDILELVRSVSKEEK